VLAEQRVEGARSIVDFHALVDNNVVVLVEAKSPSVMDMLGNLLPPNSIEMTWVSGSKTLVSKIFSKVGM